MINEGIEAVTFGDPISSITEVVPIVRDLEPCVPGLSSGSSVAPTSPGFDPEPKYLRELDTAIDGVLNEHPNGKTLFIKHVLYRSIGVKILSANEFSLFLGAISDHVRIRKLGKGAYRIARQQGTSKVNQRKLPLNKQPVVHSEHVVVANSLEEMLDVWRETAPKGKHKRSSRRRNHYKVASVLDDYNPED